MQSAKTSGQSPRANPNTYAPSVPISVYRELAAELQTVQSQVDFFKTQNQQLVKQNQQLRIEIERVVQSSLQLRQVADTFQPSSWTGASEAIAPEPEISVEPVQLITKPHAPRRNPAPKNEPVVDPAINAEELFTHQESQPQRLPKPESTRDLSGWWLAGIIFLIMVTAFGAGFAIVSPLLPKR